MIEVQAMYMVIRKNRDISYTKVEALQDYFNEGAKVWTNGVFDLLHCGHIELFRFCRSFGRVIVGVNADESAKNLPKTHPIINCSVDRAMVVASLEDVSCVVIYDEPTATNCLKAIQPEYFIKGGDYTIEQLDGEEVKAAKSYGGTVLLSPKVEGKSTTKMYDEIFERGYNKGYDVGFEIGEGQT